MADIDKALPNVEQEIKLPSEEEIAEASQENIEEQVGPEDVQVEQDEDGGATITFDPEAINQPGTNEHFDNLADLIPVYVRTNTNLSVFITGNIHPAKNKGAK